MTLAYFLRGAKKRSKNFSKIKQYEEESIDWAKNLFHEKDDVNDRLYHTVKLKYIE